MKLYSIQICCTLRGNDWTEHVHLHCCNPLYKSEEEALAALKEEIEREYANCSDYKRFEAEYPYFDESYGYWRDGYFKCAYKFGPRTRYDIYIVAHKL